MLTKLLTASGLVLAVSACASAGSGSAQPRAAGSEPCAMTPLEHRRSAAHEERRAQAARWRTVTSKQGVLERQQSRRVMAQGPVAAAQHREAADDAAACP